MRVGDIAVTGVSDGIMRVSATAMFPGTTDEDWSHHRELLNDDGVLELGVGGFLVRTAGRVLLVDAGLGPSRLGTTGHLLDSLTALGVRPGDVTDVVFTHLHFDHVGWATVDGRPVFPGATYRCHDADWAFFCGADPHDESATVGLVGGLPALERLTPVADRLETWSGDCTLAPGVDVRTAPGHTPGSTVLVLSSGTERAVLLGDVTHCPAQLVRSEWSSIADVDPALARRTREAWARELEGAPVAVASPHFPGMRFGRLLPGAARRQWVFSGDEA